MSESKMGHLQCFLRRRNHLKDRIADFRNNGKNPLGHDISEIQAIEWFLVEYGEEILKHSEDEGFKQAFLAHVPVEDFKYNMELRKQRRQKKKQEADDKRNYRKAVEKIAKGEDLSFLERMAYEKTDNQGNL